MEQFEDLLVRILLLAACISFVSLLPLFLAQWNYSEVSTEYKIQFASDGHRVFRDKDGKIPASPASIFG